jgi:hypothetical protein
MIIRTPTGGQGERTAKFTLTAADNEPAERQQSLGDESRRNPSFSRAVFTDFLWTLYTNFTEHAIQ